MNRLPGIVFALISMILPAPEANSGDHIPITLEDIFQKYQFLPAGMDGIWSMADGEYYTLLEGGRDIVRYDYKTGTDRDVLFSLDQIENEPIGCIDDYQFSSDENRILLTSLKTSRYRHSFDARYHIYDLVNKKLIPLTASDPVQYAGFSPDGTKVAYVKDNNLYCLNLKNSALTKITSDGLVNSIINGAPDWLYEEEFTLTRAYSWSPDSRKIAFYRIDESQVPEFDMTQFHDLYPATYRFKYPKAGEKNPVVQIRVYDMGTGRTVTMDAQETDQYIPRISWTASSDTLCLIRLNRLQNRVDVLLCNARNGISGMVYREENRCFISEITDEFIHFTPDGRYFIIRSEQTGRFHYRLYSISGKFLNALTEGDWDVTEVLGTDDVNRTFYYASTEDSHLGRSVYSVKFDGSHRTRLSENAGTHSASFSRTFKYFIDTWSDANTPTRITVCKSNGTFLRVLEDNVILRHTLSCHGFAQKKFITIPVGNDLTLDAYLVLPPDFDSSKVYPLFIKVYGGPESQEVTDSWSNDMPWQQYLAQHGIIVASIDNRGTDGKGEAFSKSIYMNLGKLESDDQVRAAKYLGRKSWIDENRIGIWGWSYGGFMSLLCMMKGPDVYRMGIAVAPVTNWRFYDTVYTERYMRTPKENPDGYDLNSPIHLADALKGKLLLVHGTADDNVHFQNTVALTDQLVRKDKSFETFFYPNKNHNITGGNTRYHLYSMMTRFVLENL